MKIFFPKLDSLRFIAFFLVFWDHGFSPVFEKFFAAEHFTVLKPFLRTGSLGVHIFFVLSGFLITYLLITEYKHANGVNIKAFYVRRSLRVWPLYYLIMLLSVFVLPRYTSFFNYCGNLNFSLLFLNNFDVIHNAGNCFSPNTSVAWSIAIEEQFYLVWPVLFVIFYRFPVYKYLMCGAVFLFGIYFSHSATNPDVSYYHTISNSVYLITGCFGAFLLNDLDEGKKTAFFEAMSKRINMLLVAFVCILLARPFFYGLQVLSSFLFPLFYLALIVWFSFCVEGKRNIFDRFGKYTYGMYFYHAMILIMTYFLFDIFGFDYQNNIYNLVMLVTLSLVITGCCSYFSYLVFEKPFLRLKERFAIVKTR